MILERCLLRLTRRGARVTREGERTWRTLSHVDTAVDSVYTAGSALPPSVFAGMIVYYHPLSKAFKITRSLFSHPVYEYSDAHRNYARYRTRSRTRVSAVRMFGPAAWNDLRFVLTGWRPPRVAPIRGRAPQLYVPTLVSRSHRR